MDKEILERVRLAVEFYKNHVNPEPVDLEEFLTWLYSLYGIAKPKR